MQIDNAAERGKAPLMSAFPRMTRPFTEPVTATNDRVIGPGVSLPELIKLFYPGAIPYGYEGKFGFLDRDNKSRTYNPGKEDPFIFKSAKSMDEFRTHAKQLINLLNTQWTDLGFRLKFDDDRKLDVVDSSHAMEALDPSHPLHSVLTANRNAIYFIIANSDIMKKACIVRTVNAGWWCVSYSGKTTASKKFFSMSLSAHRRAIKMIAASPKGKRLYHQLWNEASDPLDTNPGYPFFTVEMDKQGNPTTRIKTVELFRNLQRSNGFDWNKLIADVDSRAGQYGMEGYPFCVACLRRQQPGRKWQHQFNVTPSGMRTAFDEKGPNSQRVAWMVPYAYNVILTPFQCLLKSVRMILPGLYHDGESKLRRMERLKSMAKTNKLWLAEADYSNYDRFIPVDVIQDIVDYFADLTPQPSYWSTAAMYLHRDANITWPDFSSVSSGNGWLFKPGQLGLLSGVKPTSEAGTLVNSVVNAEVLARTYGWTEDRLVDYLTQYVDSPTGSKMEYYYIQSDDTELIATGPETLLRQANLFKEAVVAAGLKGDVEIADRFLMRHMQDGCDRPVPARVWQNTLSNESPPASELIFLAGLAARTDGLLGLKTVDPFNTGTVQSMSYQEAEFTTAMLASLEHFMRSASSPSQSAASFITQMKLAGEKLLGDKNIKTVKCHAGAALPFSNFRKNVSTALAKEQEATLAALSKSGSVEHWLYGLYKDKNVPSSALMLEQLTSLNSAIAGNIKMMAAKEESFFKYAAETIGVKPLF